MCEAKAAGIKPPTVDVSMRSIKVEDIRRTRVGGGGCEGEEASPRAAESMLSWMSSPVVPWSSAESGTENMSAVRLSSTESFSN